VYRFELWADGTKVLTVRDSGVMDGQVTLSPGNHLLEFIARNTAGQQVRATRNITVSENASCIVPATPGVNVCTPQDGATVATTFDVEAYANVTGGVYRFELWADGTKVLTERDSGVMNSQVTLSPGGHLLEFVARNTAGDQVRATRNITVSGTSACTPPDTQGVNVCTPQDGATVTTTFGVEAYANVTGGVYRFELWSDGVKVLTVRDSGVMNAQVTLVQGNHLLEFVARNTAGDLVRATRQITVSGTAGCSAPNTPGVNVCTPVDGATVATTFDVEAYANVTGGVYRFELWTNGTKIINVRDSGEMKASVTLAPGSYVLEFVARNADSSQIESKAVNVVVSQ
jgi:nitrogen fixation protein FixH